LYRAIKLDQPKKSTEAENCLKMSTQKVSSLIGQSGGYVLGTGCLGIDVHCQWAGRESNEDRGAIDQSRIFSYSRKN
jgi:hypothetical protein